jgi:hypothetical protein
MKRRNSTTRAIASAVVVGLLLTVELSDLARADSFTWTVTADRSTVLAGVPTAVTLTVSGPPLDQSGELINCIVIRIPAVYGVGTTSYADSRGFSWTVNYSIGSLTAKDAGNLLGLATPLDRLTLRVTVTGTKAGPADWIATAYDRNDCKHNPSPAPPIPMAIVGSTPTPTPTARPRPTARPTPTPTPIARPTPTPTLPAFSSPSVPPTSAASSSPPTPFPPQGTPSGQPPLSLTGGGAGSGPPAGGTLPGPLASPELRVAPLVDAADLTFGDAAFSTGFGAFAWTVPGFLLGLPGLLLLLIFAAQTTSVAFFVPITRRVLGTKRGRSGSESPRDSCLG